jgi:hypothetical protein
MYAQANMGHPSCYFGFAVGSTVADERLWYPTLAGLITCSEANASLAVTRSATEEAVEQHDENDAADQDVEFVLLDRKTVDAKSDAHDWGRDQKQNT